MKVSQKAIEIIQQRLKNVDNSTSAEELKKLSNAVVSMSRLETTEDILDISGTKLGEITDYGNKCGNDIDLRGNAELAGLFDARNEKVSDISNSKQASIDKISSFSKVRQGDINDILDHFRTQIPGGSSICKEISAKLDNYKFSKPGNLPFIFGILSRYDDYFGGFTSELGSWYNSAADTMLGLLTGAHTYTTQYAGFYMEPKICFLQGLHGNFLKKKSYIKYQNTTSQYSYPYAALGCLFVKNKTASSITSTITFGGSSYSSTGGASMFVGVPNVANETITWTNVYSYSSTSNNLSSTASITIPANTSVCVLFYTSSYYNSTTSSYHVQFLQWRLNSIRSSFLVIGLEIDVEKTLKAWQCKGFSNAYGLWK